MLALPTFLILSICKDLEWKLWEGITTNRDVKHMSVHPLARVQDDMLSKFIDKHGRKLITHKVKIRNFPYYIPDIMTMSITPHLTDGMTYISKKLVSLVCFRSTGRRIAKPISMMHRCKILSGACRQVPHSPCGYHLYRPLCDTSCSSSYLRVIESPRHEI